MNPDTIKKAIALTETVTTALEVISESLKEMNSELEKMLAEWGDE